MSELNPHIDPEGLLEFSVVFTDRSVNHMSNLFKTTIKELSATLKKVYGARSTIFVPGGGTFAMESVARQFAGGKRCLVLRHGWFSYRWSQILGQGKIASEVKVLTARPDDESDQPVFRPAPVDEVVSVIKSYKPDVVFFPHVETSSGIMLPESYLRAVAEAARSVGGMTVADCIASGAIWLNLKETGLDVLIGAPQKGWSASPCAGFVMLGEEARERIENTENDSFSLDLRKRLGIIEAFEKGSMAYHTTLPTDGLLTFREAVRETEEIGFEKIRNAQLELGSKARKLLTSKGVRMVSPEAFQAPGVMVGHTTDDGIHNGSKFAALGLQIAAGVPLRCGEPENYKTFRIGLFGLDKLQHIDRTLKNLSSALDEIF